MKRLIALLAAVLLVIGIAACASTGDTGSVKDDSSKAAPAESSKQPAAEDSSAASKAEAESSAVESSAVPEDSTPVDSAVDHSDVLVVFFSATGTTKGVAEKIAGLTNADLYEITAKEPYSSADLNYNDRNSRSTKEQNDKNARPEIGSEDLSLEGYTTIYLGFPIWWGEEPRILDTFVEKYSFEGITLIPFCTSASSGIGRSGPNMEALAGSGTWLDGKRFGGNVSEADLQSWIDGLK